MLMRRRAIQPKIKVDPTSTDRVVDLAALGGIIYGIAIVLLNWNQIPNRVPRHFDFWGRPDAWGAKTNIMYTLGFMVSLYVILTVLNHFPHLFNYLVIITEENAPRQYAIATSAIRWFKLELVWFFAYLLWTSINISYGRSTRLDPWSVAIFFGAIVVTEIVLFVKSRRAR